MGGKMTEADIRAVLDGLPNVRVTQVDILWSVCAGGLSGAGKDGLDVARRIRSEYEHMKPRPAVEAGLGRTPWRAEAPVQVGHDDEPDDLEIPRFLAPDPLESVPDPLRMLAEPGETVAAMQARLWALWRELNGKLMLNLANPEEIALHTRLHNELHWIAPPIEGDA